MAVCDILKGAYLVSSGNNNVLIDGVSAEFSDEYIKCLNSVVSDIDAIILNYAFPSNVGMLSRLLDIYPDITVYASPAGLRNIEEIVNRDFKHGVCKNNGSVQYGDLKFTFSLIPGTPWPDKMMTYCESENALFAGDLFGDGYLEERLGFCRECTLSAMDIAEKYNPGVIYSRKNKIDDVSGVVAGYRRFFELNTDSENTVIAYSSVSGYTSEMAQKAASLLEENDVCVKLVNIDEDPSGAAHAVNYGSSLLLGVHTEDRNMPVSVWKFMSELNVSAVSGKKYLVFGSSGWSGEGINIADKILSELRMRRFDKPFEVTFKANDMSAFEKYISNIFSGMEDD